MPSDSCVIDKVWHAGKDVPYAPEDIVLRLVLGSGPTADGDVSSNVWVCAWSDQEKQVTVYIAPERGAFSACSSCIQWAHIRHVQAMDKARCTSTDSLGSLRNRANRTTFSPRS